MKWLFGKRGTNNSGVNGPTPSGVDGPTPDWQGHQPGWLGKPLPKAAVPERQTRRLLALAAIYDGASRTEAAAVGGVTLQIVRDWVLKLNAGGPAALADHKGGGPQPILTDVHRVALAQAIEDGPMPAIHGVVRWRVIDLVQWLSDGFQVVVSKQTLSRELRKMGYLRLSARPGRGTMLRRQAQSRLLKKLPRAFGRDRARGGYRRQRRRGLVRR